MHKKVEENILNILNLYCALLQREANYTGRYAMISFIEQAQGYAAFQSNPTTRYIHMLSIPLIILSFMILLGFVRVVILGVLNIDVAEIATFALLVYSFYLYWRLALALTPILIFLLWIAEYFSYQGPTSFALWSFALIFLFGCALQFIGYFIEGKRPPFTDFPKRMRIAPLSLVADIFFMAGRMRGLKDEIYGKSIVQMPSQTPGVR